MTIRKLSKELIDNIFENELKQKEPHQHNILIKLYKIVFPNYDKIKKILDYPKISKDTNNYLFSKFIQFDKKIHPDVLSGGLWMNNGFSSLDNNLDNWLVEPCEYELKKDE